jgi:hypothetical protein
VTALPEAFYLPRGDGRYEPTRATESPWDTSAQHGGPPAALLAHEVAATVEPGLRPARVAVDFLGAIPRRELTVEVSPVRPGRLVSLSEARMVVDGRTAVTARCWSIATGPTPPVSTAQTPPPPLPDATEARFFPGLTAWGYGEAIEWRFTSGGYDIPGDAGVWTRVRLPLVAGEELTGTERALLAGDSANGLSSVLPIGDWWSIPPAMSATLLRPPAGEWVHLECRTQLADDGVGMATAVLSDPAGAVGEVAQALLVRER